jgi:hypothetical protein
MILPRIQQADVPLPVNPEQIRVRPLIEPGFEVDLFAGKKRQRAGLVDLQATLTSTVSRPDPDDQFARQRAWGRCRLVNDHEGVL